MSLPIAEQTACKTFKSGHLQVVLYTLDYGTHRDTLACFPGSEIANLSLPEGDLDAAMAIKAIESAFKQSDVARDEIETLVMWDNGPDVVGMVPYIEPAAPGSDR